MGKKTEDSNTIKARQNKIFWIISSAVLLIVMILVITFLMPGSSKDVNNTLSKRSNTFDVTKKVSDQSAWKYKSERILENALKDIRESSSEGAEALKKRIDELEVKLEKQQLDIRNSEKKEIVVNELLEKLADDAEMVNDRREPILKDQNSQLSENVTGHQQWQRPAKVVNRQYLPNHLVSNNSSSSPTVNVEPHSGNALNHTGILSINLKLKPNNEVDKNKFPTIDEVIPAGSFARGILLNGVDVSTGDFAKTNPSPILIRLVDKGSLPNEVVGDMKDCRIIASAFGHRSNERAEVRVENITCIQEDNQVISTDVNGYIVGSDGKQGIKGNLIRRSTELLWEGALAQAMSSMAKAVSSASGTTSISPAGVVRTFDTKQVMENVAYSGAGGAFDRLAEQAIKELDEIKPIIQISASIPVDVVFIGNSEFGAKKGPIKTSSNQMTGMGNKE